MRCLLISDKFDPSIRSKKEEIQVITKSLTQVSELTREIKLVAAQKEFIPAFLEGIRTLGSTKVQRVDIISDKLYKIPAEACRKLPPQPSLTSLGVNLLPKGLPPRTSSYQQEFLVKILLEAAPNLTTLDVAASLYPNLEGCKSLKVLKFECMAHLMDYRRNRNLAKLTDMLAHVKDSLIELELNIWESTEKMKSVTGGPVMSKLTTLSIHPTDANEILDFFDEDHFPKLKTLRVHDIGGDSSFLSFLNLWRRHSGVQSLALTMNSFEGWEDMEFGEKIVDLFPTVKEFKLALEDIHFTAIPAVSNIIEPFKTWDLEGVSVHVDGVTQTSVLVDVLKAMSGLKGVKSARFSDTYVNESNFSPHVQDLILRSREYQRVEISGRVVPEIVKRFQLIFEASGAPIHFTGGVANGFGAQQINYRALCNLLNGF
ncbi:uncharacterized protein LOC118437343 isoform X2 [Folsomia candida]|nr:uncharacterized protein LOC118437343 isoform X2 [Folsomia candida]